MFKTSETTDKLDAAICDMQCEFKPLVKDKVNPFYNSKYASMDSVLEATKDARKKFKISVTQWLHGTSELRLLTTRVAHAGQWIMSTMQIPVLKQDAQGVKSAYTLLERAAYTAAVGISPDEDDDGNASTGKNLMPTTKPIQNFAPKPTNQPPRDKSF